MPRFRHNQKLLAVACGMVFFSLWIDKGIGLIVAAFVPSPLGAVTEYAPSLPEALIVSGRLGASGSLILTVLYKIVLVRCRGRAVDSVEVRQMKRQINEDWLAVCLGLFLFALSLASFFGVDALGWAVTTSVWTNPAKMLAPASKSYATLSGFASLLLTYLFLLVVMTLGAKALRLDLGRFAKGFTAVFVARLPVLDAGQLGVHRRHAR